MDEAEAREKIHNLLLTGDNRLKQGVSAEKIRQSYEQALAVAREAGSRSRSGRWSRSGSPISNGSQEDRLHPLRLTPDVVLRRSGARGLVRRRQRRGRLERARERVRVERVDEDARVRA